MKKLLLIVFFCGAVFAQIQDIPGTEAIGVSRQKIVDNFNYLNLGKASATMGSALPSNCTYNPEGPAILFINTSVPTLNLCVATNSWAPLIGGGSSGPATWGQIAGALTDQADLVAALSGKEPANANIQQHIGSTNNPHSTTKAQVGLGNVTNDSQLKIANNLGDLGNVPSARTNLGLGGAAILNVGAIAGTVAAGDHLHDARYSQIGHEHAAGDVTSGLFAPTRLGSGAADSTVVLYGDNVWRTPPGSSGGEANTASNQGTMGVGVFKSKLGVDLGFYKLNPASASSR